MASSSVIAIVEFPSTVGLWRRTLEPHAYVGRVNATQSKRSHPSRTMTPDEFRAVWGGSKMKNARMVPLPRWISGGPSLPRLRVNPRNQCRNDSPYQGTTTNAREAPPRSKDDYLL